MRQRVGGSRQCVQEYLLHTQAQVLEMVFTRPASIDSQTVQNSLRKSELIFLSPQNFNFKLRRKSFTIVRRIEYYDYNRDYTIGAQLVSK